MWQRKLYKKQNYSSSYMPYSKIKYIFSTSSFYDLSRFIQSITNVFVFFSLHLTLTTRRLKIYAYSLHFIIGISILFMYKIKVKRIIRLSCIIILWCYLLTPVIHTFVVEISSDTIYAYFFILNLIYCIDLTKSNILNEINEINEHKNESVQKKGKKIYASNFTIKKYIKDIISKVTTKIKFYTYSNMNKKVKNSKKNSNGKDHIRLSTKLYTKEKLQSEKNISPDISSKIQESDDFKFSNTTETLPCSFFVESNIYDGVLSLEDTYINYHAYNISIVGYNCNIIASILLCSRYESRDMAFFTLWFNLMFFIGLPYITEKIKVHENLILSFLNISLGFCVTFYANYNLFLSYLILITLLFCASICTLFY